MQIAAQIIGIVVVPLMMLSYQQKTQMRIIIFQIVCSTLFAFHYLLLGAMGAFFVNSIGLVRAFVYARGSRDAWAAHPAWIGVFSALYFVGYFVTLKYTYETVDIWIILLELLPVSAGILANFAFRMREARLVKILSAFISPQWLVYNIAKLSVGGIINELLVFTSIIIGLARDTREKKANERAALEKSRADGGE
ncbi:MAG: YgjV family protein [Clostridia bacterium]|nr:YgjV family protein [Clostridia bacterium]